MMRSLGANGIFQIALKPRLVGRYDLKTFLDEKAIPIDLNLLDKSKLMRA